MELCVVPGCNSLGCQSFPKDPELKALWEQVIQVKAKDHSRICKKHFRKSDYMAAVGISALTGEAQACRFLKKDVVPSVFPWSHRSDDISASSPSIKSEQQKEADLLQAHSEDNKVTKVTGKHHIELIRKVVSKDPSSKITLVPYFKNCKILPKVYVVAQPNTENNKISPKTVSAPQPDVGNSEISPKTVSTPQPDIGNTKISPKTVSTPQPDVGNSEISPKNFLVPQPNIGKSKISSKAVSAPQLDIGYSKILPKKVSVPHHNIGSSKISRHIVLIPHHNIGNSNISPKEGLGPKTNIGNGKSSKQIVLVHQPDNKNNKISPQTVVVPQSNIANSKISQQIVPVPQQNIGNNPMSSQMIVIPQPRIKNSRKSPKIVPVPQSHIEYRKIAPKIVSVPQSHIENNKISPQIVSVLQPHIENGKIVLKIASTPHAPIENNIIAPKITQVEKKSGKSNLVPIETVISASSVNLKNLNKQNGDVKCVRCRCCSMEQNVRHDDAKIDLRMIRNSLNLYLSTDPRLSQLICSACAAFLKELKAFREMIMESEGYLKRVISVNDVPVEESSQNYDSVIPVVKTEYVASLDASLECLDDMPELDDFTDLSDDKSLLKTEIEINFNCTPEAFEDYKYTDDSIVKTEYEEISENILRESIQDYKYTEDAVVKTEDEEISENCDRESIQDDEYKDDTIVKTEEQTGKCNPETNQEIFIKPVKCMQKRPLEDDQMESTKKMKNHDSESNVSTSQIKAKQSLLYIPDYITIDSKFEVASENTKIRANIILLLKYSTIIPFRNNLNHTFKCFYCDKVCLPFKCLREHTETHTGKISDTAIFKSLRARLQKTVYADTSTINCRLCGERFKDINGVVEHLTETHKKVYYTTDTNPPHGILEFHLGSDTLKCHICQKEFPVFKRLFCHMNEHIGSFICSCGKKFIFVPNYNYHRAACLRKNEKRKSDENFKSKVKCSLCSETFSVNQYLKRLKHMQEVHGVTRPSCKCLTCGKIYTKTHSLRDHIRKFHRNVKKVKCELCGYRTGYLNMKDHMNLHYGIKSHECTLCKKRFTTRYSLRMHKKVHTNDKRFDCTVCDAAFIQKHVLKSHMKAKHPDVSIYSIK